ncbi:MAG TPA: TrkH family potassium uptake protein [Spirochaetota bacterium]|jgi:trk system potassium uptake protein TrkH|nr:TrkH family potassium uptake protein [Spirochaetota bacterium]
MNPLTIYKIISYLLLIISAFMLIPAAIALYIEEYQCLQAFIIAISIACINFIAMYIITKDNKNNSLSLKDGFLFVTLSWVFASLLGALPFYISGSIPSFTDSYFETMSGFTTTGASILTNIEGLPASMLFWRSLTHWLGGMGIVVLTVAVLPLLGIGGMQLIKAEAPGPTVDKITPKIAETAKILWMIYTGLTIAETLLLMLGGMTLFDALTHTFATLATGGFSTKNTSIAYYNSTYIDWVITTFMVLAGINFSLHFRFLSGKFKFLLKDSEFKAYIAIFISAVLIIAINIYGTHYKTLSDSFRYAGFQAASILTTTGFATADYESWPALSQAVLFILMFIGGCAGSTGGGIKVIRIITLLKQALNEMKYLLHPKGVFTLRINREPVKKDIIYAISGFFFLYIFMLLATTFISSSSGVDIITSFTSALATVGNIGPGFGLVGPSENFAFFKDYVKWFFSFAMLTGRLELYTVLIIFTRSFWKL